MVLVITILVVLDWGLEQAVPYAESAGENGVRLGVVSVESDELGHFFV